MRRTLVSKTTVVAFTALVFVVLVGLGNRVVQAQKTGPSFDKAVQSNVSARFADGKRIFRYDTFGDEDFWGGQLKLHQAIQGSKLGGVGAGVSPKTALSLGLKVDVDALPSSLQRDIKAGKVNLDDPATTVALLKANAVVGVIGFMDSSGKRLNSMGITCALCHSTVDDSFGPGIGRRLDGWANRDLNVGQIIAAAPDLSPFANLLGVSQDTVRKVVTSWGPGKFDAQLILDGKAFRPDGKPAATLIPAAYGLAGVNQHAWTGSWGTVTYWNAFVGNLEMNGKGRFFDPRLNDPVKYPIAARAGLWNIKRTPDMLTSKLPALHTYQLSLPAPTPPASSFDRNAARRGRTTFMGKGTCSNCHVPPTFTEPGWNLHRPEDIGIDAFQANRSPDNRYRTAPLKGLWAHQKGGFYHDGRFPTLMDVVNHYNTFLKLNLTSGEKSDLVEYLKSLPDEETGAAR